VSTTASRKARSGSGSSASAKESKPGTGRRRPKGDKRERTRAALLDAALALTREKGFEETTLADVAGNELPPAVRELVADPEAWAPHP
jgi:hypothetical protein